MTVVAVIRVDVDGIGKVEGAIPTERNLRRDFIGCPFSLSRLFTGYFRLLTCTAVPRCSTRYLTRRRLPCFHVHAAEDVLDIRLSPGSAQVTYRPPQYHSHYSPRPFHVPRCSPHSACGLLLTSPFILEARAVANVAFPHRTQLAAWLHPWPQPRHGTTPNNSSWISLSRFPSRRITRLPTASMTTGQSTVCRPPPCVTGS